MHVYIDYIFIENFIFDFLIIYQTEMLLKINTNLKRKIIASVISSIYVCTMVILKLQILDTFLLKMLLSFAVVYVAFGPKQIGKYLKTIAVYYLSSVINVGTTVFVEQILNVEMNKILVKLLVYLISLYLSFIFTKQIWKLYKNNININSLIYDVEFEIEGKKYCYKGFLDTGNTVKNFELGVPIVFAEYLDEIQKEKIARVSKFKTEAATISSLNYYDTTYIKSATINGRKLKLGIVFVDNKLDKKNQYNMILNYCIFEEHLGGISI